MTVRGQAAESIELPADIFAFSAECFRRGWRSVYLDVKVCAYKRTHTYTHRHNT